MELWQSDEPSQNEKCDYIFEEQNFNSAVLDVYLTEKGWRVFSLLVLNEWMNGWMTDFEHQRLDSQTFLILCSSVTGPKHYAFTHDSFLLFIAQFTFSHSNIYCFVLFLISLVSRVPLNLYISLLVYSVNYKKAKKPTMKICFKCFTISTLLYHPLLIVLRPPS